MLNLEPKGQTAGPYLLSGLWNRFRKQVLISLASFAWDSSCELEHPILPDVLLQSSYPLPHASGLDQLFQPPVSLVTLTGEDLLVRSENFKPVPRMVSACGVALATVCSHEDSKQ